MLRAVITRRQSLMRDDSNFRWFRVIPIIPIFAEELWTPIGNSAWWCLPILCKKNNAECLPRGAGLQTLCQDNLRKFRGCDGPGGKVTVVQVNQLGRLSLDTMKSDAYFSKMRLFETPRTANTPRWDCSNTPNSKYLSVLSSDPLQGIFGAFGVKIWPRHCQRLH